MGGGMSGGGYGMGGGMGGGYGAGGMQGGYGAGARRAGAFGYNAGANSSAPAVRIVLTLDKSDMPVADLTAASSRIATHLAALPALYWVSPPQVAVKEHTTILRGVVASDHDRDLAERVVLLEPTVAEVDNQIVVDRQAVAAKK